MKVLFGYLTLLFLFSSCGSSATRDAVGKIKKRYQAEDLTWHKIPLYKPGEEEFLELIVINSAQLKDNKLDYIEGLNIAKIFYQSFDDHTGLSGVRVVITNRNESESSMGFSKDYYYDKALLK